MMSWTFLFSLLIPLALAQDSECPESTTCIVFKGSPCSVEIRILKKTDIIEYKKRLALVKKSICNQAEKKICCRTQKDDGSNEVGIGKGTNIQHRDTEITALTTPTKTITTTPTTTTTTTPTTTTASTSTTRFSFVFFGKPTTMTTASPTTIATRTTSTTITTTTITTTITTTRIATTITTTTTTSTTTTTTTTTTTKTTTTTITSTTTPTTITTPTTTTASRQSPMTQDMYSPGWIPLASKGECGEEDAALIVGGENTKLGEMPWTALMGAVSSKSGKFKWKCGGTVINKWYVVTAAHCKPVTKVRLGEWRVIVTAKPNKRRAIVFSEEQRQNCGPACDHYALADGTRDCTLGGTSFRFAKEGGNAHCGGPYQDFNVKTFLRHPGYKILRSNVVINDIALVKLSSPALLNSEGEFLVSPICLPLPSDGLVEDERDEGTVIGWGKTYVNDGVISTVKSSKQKKLEMPLINNTECRKHMSKLFKSKLSGDIVPEHHLCAGAVKDKDSCNGDSGGPFIVRKDSNSPYTLAGVVSFGSAKCGIGTPAIFARVHTYVEWIKENLV